MIETTTRSYTPPKKAPSYPYIAYHTHHKQNPIYVIFTRPEFGVVIKNGSGENYEVGHSCMFAEYNFTKCTDELVLRNKD